MYRVESWKNCVYYSLCFRIFFFTLDVVKCRGNMLHKMFIPYIISSASVFLSTEVYQVVNFVLWKIMH